MASAADVPKLLADTCAIYENATVEFVRLDDGLYLKQRQTKQLTYAGLFTAELKGGDIFVTCTLCKKTGHVLEIRLT